MISIINQFTAWLYQVGYSESTQHMLPACAREFLEQQQITDIRYLEPQQVRDFYTWLQERPLKRRSGVLSEMMIHHYVYALKTFFTWLEITGQIEGNPISGMTFKRPPPNSRRPLSKEEMGQLFTAAATLKERAV